MWTRARAVAGLALACILAGTAARGQSGTPPAPPPAVQEKPNDPLGRSTPRGTVLGFLNVSRQGEPNLARQYLDTRLNADAAERLAQQLFVVLDARMPARLTEISDSPEGARRDPLAPNLETVGRIPSATGSVEIVLERVPRRDGGLVWLFSSRTLEAVPAVYREVMDEHNGRWLARLFALRVGQVRPVAWAILLLSLPAIYFLTLLLNRFLTPLVALVWPRGRTLRMFTGGILPRPARLLIVCLAAPSLLSLLPLALLARQFLASAAGLGSIVAITWLMILVSREVESAVRRRLPASNLGAAADLLRLGRRALELLVVFSGLLATLRHFGLDPTPALAGLGVGGIAVALAAQKTLENVIAGASLIFDQAVRVGDTLKVGDVVGTVDHIGLRSTRIRTLDRSMVSIPNSQIANASLETLSARDQFWFHPIVGLRYETTPEQLHAVIDGIRQLLAQHAAADPESIRVRFIRLGAFSLDVETFAYLRARDWSHFLELQEALLFSITEIVSAAGTSIAFPSQTLYVGDTAASTVATQVAPR